MWQHVLSAQTLCGATCQLCGEPVSDEKQLEHCFLQCPKTDDLRRSQPSLTAEEIQHPEPHQFRQVLAFVARVLERRRWLAAESDPERREPDQEVEKEETQDTSPKGDGATSLHEEGPKQMPQSHRPPATPLTSSTGPSNPPV